MSKMILDFGSGNTCKNDRKYIKRMYDELKSIDTGKNEIIVKWQLFKVAGANIPLTDESFDFAYDYGNELGYQITASVYDRTSLESLLMSNVPFVFLGNRRELDYLIDFVPEGIPTYIEKSDNLSISYKNKVIAGLGCVSVPRDTMKEFWCINKCPAQISDYEKLPIKKHDNISDHTIDFKLFKKYEPEIIKWKYKLTDSTGFDSGNYARTPEQLKEVL